MNAKLSLPLLAAMLSVACVLSGCQSPKARAPSGGSVAQSTRNNCYSLLHQLLNDQKNVSLLRFIKREQEDVKTLVKKIATNSATGAKLLEEFARHDPSITLDDIRLPPGEAATREAIASTKEKELLSQTGGEFELSLLLTQAEALRRLPPTPQLEQSSWRNLPGTILRSLWTTSGFPPGRPDVVQSD